MMYTGHKYQWEDVNMAIQGIKNADTMEILFQILDKNPDFRDKALSFMVDKNIDPIMINKVLEKYGLEVTKKIKNHVLECGIGKRDVETIRQLLKFSSPDFRIEIMYRLAVGKKDKWLSEFLQVYPEIAVSYLFRPQLDKNDFLHLVSGFYLVELIANYKLWQSLRTFTKIIGEYPRLKFPERDGRYLKIHFYNYAYDYGLRIPLHPMTLALFIAVEHNKAEVVRLLLEAGAQFPEGKISRYGTNGITRTDLIEIALEKNNEKIVRDLFLFGYPRSNAFLNDATYIKGWNLCMAMQQRQTKFLALMTVIKACAYGRASFSILTVDVIFQIFQRIMPFGYAVSPASINNQLITFKTEAFLKGINAVARYPLKLLCHMEPLLHHINEIKQKNFMVLSEKQKALNMEITKFLLTLPVDNLKASREVQLLDKYHLLNNGHQILIINRQNWLQKIFKLSNAALKNANEVFYQSEILPEIHSYQGKISLETSLLKQIKILCAENKNSEKNPDGETKVSQFLYKLLTQEKTWESEFFWSLCKDGLDKDLLRETIRLIPDIDVREKCLLIALQGLSDAGKGKLYDACHAKRWKPGIFWDSTVTLLEKDLIQLYKSSMTEESCIQELPEDLSNPEESGSDNGMGKF